MHEALPVTEDESPFIPGTNIQFAWDSTSLGYIKQCPRLYQYLMIDGWHAGEESVHLRFGNELHLCEEHYASERNAGREHDDAMLHVVHELLNRTYGWEVDEDTRTGKYKNRLSLLRTVVDFLDNYNLDVEDPAQVYIKEDGEPATELSFRFELDFAPAGHEQPYVLCGHLDKIVRYNEELFVKDTKTTTYTMGTYWFNQFEPNNQMSLYTIASEVILGSPIKGVMIDGVQVLIGSTRCVRGFTMRTQDQLDEWLNDLAYWLGQAELYAEQNYWPQNDTACDKYGGCRFREVCSKSPPVREVFLKSSFVKGESWNPLKPR